jgi:alkylation response protein AidB-like acyl-CoA dehydrogenase
LQSRGEASPYYNSTHVAWRARVRAFVDARVIPFCDEWDESGYPKALHREARGLHVGLFEAPSRRGNAGLHWLRFARV